MHLCSYLLPRYSTNNPLDNKARPMANASQAPDLKGIHHEMHEIAEQIKIMKEINARLAILEVEDPSDKVVIMAMMEGLCPGLLFNSLSKSITETWSALQDKVDKYIAVEKLAEAKRGRRGKDDHRRQEPDTRRINYTGKLIKRSEREVRRRINK
ncbi:hypothetical protein Acr_00g0074010 [Actinidia rufa]|uniref:Uncharacterized protein n=1 Tax=Actinidia rufa TaxID=165716 RepID=A0A7J0DSA3_9ERIC|nr:hypothetical protein Acr_00g0074010 [Actinidia rufa]